MNLPDSAILNNLYIPGATIPDSSFEKRYIGCRCKEKRIYSDEEVFRLPECPATHIHHGEWLLRKRSAQKLSHYLERKKKPLNILEIGCGNGWLCHFLSHISRSRITGIDINFTELQQAARVFNNRHKMKFIYGDIRSGILEEKRYDVVLFAASIQYFTPIDDILELCLHHLKPGGEIHITDSRFYSEKEAGPAEQRSVTYYSGLGFPEMAGHYFHHTLTSLAQFNHTRLFNPSSLLNRLSRQRYPFHWIRIQKDR